MIDWVFFDVGNVLFNDDAQNFFAYRFLYERVRQSRPEFTFEELLAERERQARQGVRWVVHKLAQQFFPEATVRDLFVELRGLLIPRFDDNHLLNEGVRDMLESLRPTYRLGIIANQPPECRNSLARRQLLELFEVVAISEELDLHKPDVGLLEWALREAGCEGSRAVMVGDRVDNDIMPAKRLSMRTVLLRWPDSSHKSWSPDDPQAQAYLRSCDAAPLFTVGCDDDEADRIVETPAEVPAAVESIVDESAI